MSFGLFALCFGLEEKCRSGIFILYLDHLRTDFHFRVLEVLRDVNLVIRGIYFALTNICCVYVYPTNQDLSYCVYVCVRERESVCVHLFGLLECVSIFKM